MKSPCLIVALIAASCSSQDSPKANPANPTQPAPSGAPASAAPSAQAQPATITGDWRLIRLNDHEVSAKPTPYMQVDAGANLISGRGGVNIYSGEIDAALVAKGDFKLLSLTHTEMAGAPEARALEKDFFNALHLASRFKIDSNRLTLLDSAGKAVAVFDRKSK